jgi:hypothetical protein
MNGAQGIGRLRLWGGRGLILALLTLCVTLFITWRNADNTIGALQCQLHKLQARVSLLEFENAMLKFQNQILRDLLRLEEIITPTVRVLPARPGGRPNLARVELSSRIEHGLVCEINVCWGDNGSRLEPIYQAAGYIRDSEAVHEYSLPPVGRTSSWTLVVSTVVPEAWVRNQLLSAEQLTSSYRVEATAEGIRVASLKDDTVGPKPPQGPTTAPRTEWVRPASGAEVGWLTEVVLTSQMDTERVTLLVRPHSGTSFYVQGGARPLSAGKEESFEVQLGGRRTDEIGRKFDVLAVCSDAFMPTQWSLDMSNLPVSRVIHCITVQKAAGAMRLEADGQEDEGLPHVRGEIWTPDGGALLLRRGGNFTVLKTLEPSPVGSKCDEKLRISASDSDAVYLLVYKETGRPRLCVGEMIPETLAATHWLYGPAKAANEARADP